MQRGITPGFESTSERPEAFTERHLVLLVDDYQDCREMYGAFLSMAGFDVLKARDGVEAIELAEAHTPDIVLMDLSLPGMDGLEATRRLKASLRTRDIPVVALTAQALPLPATTSGLFADCLTKPCLPDQLQTAIDHILHLRRAS